MEGREAETNSILLDDLVLSTGWPFDRLPMINHWVWNCNGYWKRWKRSPTRLARCVERRQVRRCRHGQTEGWSICLFLALSLNPSTSAPTVIDSKINLIMQNLTDPLKAHEMEDYPNDNDFDYSDYAYEDSTDQTSTTTTTTATTTTTTTPAPTTTTTTTEELSIDDTQTAYYDYGDHDVYSDDEVEEPSTTTSMTKVSARTTMTTTTTTTSNGKERIPYYHRRPPIIWNVDINDDDEQVQDVNSGSSLTYSLLLQLFIWLVRVWRNNRPVVLFLFSLSLSLVVFSSSLFFYVQKSTQNNNSIVWW